jgi:Lipocalin-like domain (DUF4923)
MKHLICISIIALICSSHPSFSQSINIPADSVTNLLCKKWEMDYVIEGGMKIGGQPGAPEMNYEFNKDKTFVLTSNMSSTKIKGTWSYDPSKKLIKLTLNGRSNISVISLTNDRIEMLLDAKAETPDAPGPIQMFYKRSAK